MPRMTPEEEAAYALDFDVAREDLSPAAQLEYEKQIKERALARSAAIDRPLAAGPQSALSPRCGECGKELAPSDRFCASCGQPANTPDTVVQEHRESLGTPRTPPPGIVLKTFGGGAGDIILGIALIGGGGSAGATVFGVLFIILGITTWILGGFGRRPWDDIPPAGRGIAGTGAVIGMVFLYVLFFWFFILRLVWKYIIAPGLRS